MIQRFEMRDKKGRLAICEFDAGRKLLKITTHFSPDLSLPIEETLKNAGYMIVSKVKVKKPKVVQLKQRSKR